MTRNTPFKQYSLLAAESILKIQAKEQKEEEKKEKEEEEKEEEEEEKEEDEEEVQDYEHSLPATFRL